MKIRFWPRSLAARTASVLLIGLALVQMAGLTIHALDRLDVQRLAQARDLAVRVVGVYRTIALTDPPRRAEVLAEMHRGPELTAVVSSSPPEVDLPAMPPLEQQLLRVNINLIPLGAPQIRWRELVIYGGHPSNHAVIGMRLPDGEWLDVTAELEPLRPWHSPTFLTAFALDDGRRGIADIVGGKAAHGAGSNLGGGGGGTRAGCQCSALTGERPDRGRGRGSSVQHDGRADPALRAGPNGVVDRHRARSANADHAAKTSGGVC